MTTYVPHEAKRRAIDTAIKEAERFIERAKLADAALLTNPHETAQGEHAAMLRASMDLTRALAQVRKVRL